MCETKMKSAKNVSHVQLFLFFSPPNKYLSITMDACKQVWGHTYTPAPHIKKMYNISGILKMFKRNASKEKRNTNNILPFLPEWHESAILVWLQNRKQHSWRGNGDMEQWTQQIARTAVARFIQSSTPQPEHSMYFHILCTWRCLHFIHFLCPAEVLLIFVSLMCGSLSPQKSACDGMLHVACAIYAKCDSKTGQCCQRMHITHICARTHSPKPRGPWRALTVLTGKEDGKLGKVKWKLRIRHGFWHIARNSQCVPLRWRKTLIFEYSPHSQVRKIWVN